jgi:hypothetical protein
MINEDGSVYSQLMKRFTATLVLFALFLCAATASAQAQRPQLVAHISSEDMALLLQEAPPEQLRAFSTDIKMRQEVLRNIRELLAEALAAINLRLADDPLVREQLDFMRALAVAQSYDSAHRTGTPPTPFAFLKQEQVDAYLGQPGTEARFDAFVVAARAGKLLPDEDIPTEQRTKLKDQWAKVRVTEQLAASEGYDQRRLTQLQITLQQATLLAQLYSRLVLASRTAASDAEIADFLAHHPEYDIAPLRAKAERVLARARAGENFAALAREFTDDPGSKENGGFYDWFGRGKMVKEFEDASFKLRPRQISGIVETRYGFHVIKVVGRRYYRDRETGKSELQVRVRHILVSTMSAPDPDNLMAPQLSLRDAAKAKVEKAKREQILDQLVVQTGVTVPDDFNVPAVPASPTDSPVPPSPTAPRQDR